MGVSKSEKVTRGNRYLMVYPWQDPRTKRRYWRFAWRKRETDRYRYKTRRTKAQAVAAAWDLLGELQDDGLVWSSLSEAEKRFLNDVYRLARPEDFPGVVAFLESRRRSSEVAESCKRFIAAKVAKDGEKTRHVANVERHLEEMAERFKGRSIVEIHDADLHAWWLDRVTAREKLTPAQKATDEEPRMIFDEKGERVLLAPKTRNEVRGSMVAFWNWAIEERLHPKDTTPADRLPLFKVGLGKKRIYSPEEMLDTCYAVTVEYRAAIVLGGFFGLRPEEVAAPKKQGMSKKDKRGLRAEEIDWRFRVIRLPEEVAKTGARNIPFFDGAEEWLEWAGLRPGSKGPVCPDNLSEVGETLRLGELVFGEEGWPQDALRHSWASNRNALLRDLGKLADEMGNSVPVLKRSYHVPLAEEEGKVWFGLRPAMLGDIRFHPMGWIKRPRKEETSVERKPGKSRVSA